MSCSKLLLLILVISNACLVGLVQGVTVSVTPSAVSNLYNGTITLVITNGLTNGETVLIEKFADFNTNGAVDAGELLVQSFVTTDGKAKVFGGVTNLNVPGDLTSTNGEIVASINFYGLDPQHITGNFVFRVSSPTGRFTPATATFSVTNSDFGQAISGVVRYNGTNVPNAMVFFLAGANQNLVGNMLTDSSGGFTFKAAPGTYMVGAAKEGYVFDFALAPQVTLNAGVDVTTNVPLNLATRILSGSLKRMGATNGLPGVFFPLESQNGSFVLAFTDASGNFNFPVSADVWKIKIESSAVASLGYLNPSDALFVDTTAGDVTNVNIELPKADSLFYGQLKNNSNVPMAGIHVSADSQNYPYSSSSITDLNGNYFIGIVGTNWNVNPSSEDLSPLGYSANSTNLNINAGHAIQINFTAQALTIHLGGRVVDTNGSPVANIKLGVNNQASGGFDGITDNDGYFNIGVTAGTWYLQVESSDATSRGLVGPSLQFSNLVDNANITNILYVMQSVTEYITGNVHDTNSSPITFVSVSGNLIVNGTNYMASAQTDSSGNYSIGVFNGTWSVNIAGNDLYNRGFDIPDNQYVTIAGANGTANFTVYPAQPLQITTVTLPVGVVFQNYHTNLQAVGGQQPYSWNLVSGSLPAGLSFNFGLLDGIPTSSGTFNFTVSVNDQQANTTSQNFSLTINPGLQITTGSLPNGTNGQPYSANLTASGGVPPYIWNTSGPLPAGINLSTNGVFSGTASSSGTAFFTVLLNDSVGNSTNKNFSITINSTGSSSAPSFVSFGKNPNGNFEMLLQGQNGMNYRFEGSTTLAPTNWMTLQTLGANVTNGQVYFQDSASAGLNYRFYRAVASP